MAARLDSSAVLHEWPDRDALDHALADAVGTALLFVLPKDTSWTSIYVQNGTLWIGFLGAVLAAAGGKHLSLATTNFMARGRLRLAFETFSQLVFVAVSLLLTYASARMVAANRGTGDADLLPGGLHRWMVELI
ncbi:MAG TPA: TRAP transporter small permease subunit, partial [Plasticicumulans sp.]|nr:TRAP transporter small permease subunit [Plasticicumulans sp.]